MIDIRHASVLISVLLSGCMSHAGQQLSASNSAADLQNLSGDQNNSGTITIAELGQVRVGRSYVAASGRTCRRLTTLSGKSLPLRSCKNKSGQWITTRILSSSASLLEYSTESGPASSAVSLPELSSDAFVDTSGALMIEAPKESVLDSSDESISRTVEEGETLWSFARRVTGNALNWKAIASYNGITEEGNISTGQRLLVEVSLVKDVR